MKCYADTSALVVVYVQAATKHQAAQSVRSVLREVDEVHVSALVEVELAATALRLVRRGELTRRLCDRLLSQFADDLTSGIFVSHPISPETLVAAVEAIHRIGERHRLDSLDAIHLAAANLVGCDAMLTGDRNLAYAAAVFGLRVFDVTT